MSIQRPIDHKPNPKRSVAFGWIALVLGAIAVIIGIGWTIHSLRLVMSANRTTGTIVEIREEPPSAGTIQQRVSEGESVGEASRPDLIPVVEYQVAGETYTIDHTVIHDSRDRSFLPKVGEEVEVLYMAEKPDGGRVDSFLSLWGGPLLFVVVGGVFAALGVFSLRSRGEGG